MSSPAVAPAHPPSKLSSIPLPSPHELFPGQQLPPNYTLPQGFKPITADLANTPLTSLPRSSGRRPRPSSSFNPPSSAPTSPAATSNTTPTPPPSIGPLSLTSTQLSDIDTAMSMHTPNSENRFKNQRLREEAGDKWKEVVYGKVRKMRTGEVCEKCPATWKEMEEMELEDWCEVARFYLWEVREGTVERYRMRWQREMW